MSVPLALVTKETELGRMKDFPCHETVVIQKSQMRFHKDFDSIVNK